MSLHALSSVVLATAMAGGCATPEVGGSRFIVHGHVAVPAALETLEVVIARDARGFEAASPRTRQELVRDIMPVSQDLQRDPFIVPAMPVVLAMGVSAFIIGGATGMLAGNSSDAIAAAQKSIGAVVAEIPFDDPIAELLYQASNARHGERAHRGLPIDLPLPQENERRARDRVDRPAIASRDARLQVRMLFQGFQTRMPDRGYQDATDLVRHANPPLALVIAAQVALLDRTSGELLGGVSLHRESIPHTLGEWAANDARLLRDELQEVRRDFLAEIQQRVTFLASSPQPQ